LHLAFKSDFFFVWFFDRVEKRHMGMKSGCFWWNRFSRVSKIYLWILDLL